MDENAVAAVLETYAQAWGLNLGEGALACARRAIRWFGGDRSEPPLPWPQPMSPEEQDELEDAVLECMASGLDVVTARLRARRRIDAHLTETQHEPLMHAHWAASPVEMAHWLLVGWRETRDPRLAVALRQLTDLHVQGLGGLPLRDDALAFVKARGDDVLERGARILAIPRLPSGRIPGWLGDALVEPPDPRWVDLWLEGVANDRFGTLEIRTQLGQIVDRMADPRVLEVDASGMLCLDPEVRERITDTAWPELSPWEERRLHSVQRSIDRARNAPTEVPALYRRAAAGDDLALAVLGDAWSAADDPRGELVTLAIHPRSPAQERRYRAVLRDWHRCLGALAPVVAKRDLVLERGLPVQVSLYEVRGEYPLHLAKAYEWHSVHTVRVPWPRVGPIETFLAELLDAHPHLELVDDDDDDDE